MRHIRLVISLLLLSSMPLVAPLVWAGERAQPQKILILNTYRIPTPWEAETSQSFRATLAAGQTGPFQLYEEYLNLAAHPNEEHKAILRDLLRVRYSHRRMDLVIAVNDQASSFLVDYGQELFPGAPLVISGGGKEMYKSPPRNRSMTSVFFEEDILGSLKLALGLLPATKHVYVVTGSGPFDTDIQAKARKQLADLGPSPQVTYLTGTSVEDLCRRVAHLPPNSLIYYIIFSRDANGNLFVPRNVCRLISQAANAPVIGLYDTFLNYGILGGKLASAESNGRTLAQVGLRILAGEDPNNMPPTREPDLVAFDWRQMKRWNLLDRSLPAGAEVRFREYSFFELYWHWILACAGVLLLQAVLIVLLLTQSRLKRQEENDRQRSENALRESEQRYRQMFASDQLVQFLIDPQDGSIVDANQAACHFYGYEHAELTQKKIYEINTSTHKKINALVQAIIDREAMSFQARHRLASNEIRDVEVYSSPITLEGRTHLHSTIFDITERKQAEEAVRQSDAQFRTLVGNAPLAILIQTGGRISYINQEGLKAFGAKSEKELLGQPVFDRVPACFHEQVKARIQQVNESKLPVPPWEYQYFRLDGTLFDVEVLSVPFHYHGQDGALVFFRDITQKKKDEADRRALEAQLRQAQKMEAIGTLAGGIAHDFNNILGAVIGYAEVAMESAQLKQDPSRDIQQILKAGERARDLVRQILTFSRKMEVELKPLDINREVKNAVALLGRTLPKMIEIDTHLADELPRVLANANQLEQILLNLASNALDAMPEGGRLAIETQNAVLDQEYCEQHLEAKPGRYLLLQVSDTGLGMDVKTKESIFDPFFTTKEVGKGTGLGLSTVFGIVKGFGGQITCYSEVGLGTTFKIYLPDYRQGESQELTDPSSAKELVGGNETILLVDDEAALRDLGERTLTKAGYNLLLAASGEEALAIYGQKHDAVNLVILDLSMPGMGGFKAMKALLQINPRVKVIIASGYAPNGSVKEALHGGALGYLAKPFKRVELLTMVRSVLDER